MSTLRYTPTSQYSVYQPLLGGEVYLCVGSIRVPRGCCFGPLLARRLLVREILVFDWTFASIGLFARVYLFLSVFLRGAASSRSLHSFRGVYSSVR